MSADKLEPWQWPEERWRRIVERVRAGRSLRPAQWPGGARCAVALSFDSDHETNELREGGESVGKLSQGQYGNRQGVPRILEILARHGVPASFFVPAVTALLYPDEQRRVVGAGHEIAIHGWIHERNSMLPLEAERDLHDALRRHAREDRRHAARRHPHPVVGFQPAHPRAHPRDGPRLRLVADGGRRLLRAPDGRREHRRRRAARRVDPRRRGLLQHEPLRGPASLHAADGRVRDLPARVRRAPTARADCSS